MSKKFPNAWAFDRRWSQFKNLHAYESFAIRGEIFSPHDYVYKVSVVIDGDYTTKGDSILKLKTNSKITLNPEPLDNEFVYIKSATGLPFSVSSSKKIDGRKEWFFSRPYICRVFSYSKELDTWSIL